MFTRRVYQTYVQLGLIVFITTSFGGCQDKAAPSYAQCVQLSIKEDVGGAWDACSAAITANPTSEAGKSAASKLIEMKPKYDVWNKSHNKKAATVQTAQGRVDKSIVAVEQNVQSRASAPFTEEQVKPLIKKIYEAKLSNQYVTITVDVKVIGISVEGKTAVVKASVLVTGEMGGIMPAEIHNCYFREYDKGWIVENCD